MPLPAKPVPDCAVFGATEAIGDAWSWLILSDAIIDDTSRFDAFQSRLGIARSTLSARLTALCANGLMTRNGRDYLLTASGADFLMCVLSAMAWGDRWHTDGRRLPTRVAHIGCDKKIRGELRCSRCNELIHARGVAFSRRPASLEQRTSSSHRHRVPGLDLLQRPRASSIAATLQIIGDRWSALIIRELFYGSKRFDEFEERLGIASNILSQRLQRLVEFDIVIKHRYQDRPARHEYRLTDRGLDLYPVPLSMLSWGDRWLSVGKPPIRLTHVACGNRLSPRLSCSSCTREITRADLVFTHQT